jgi:hypothetical protein
MDTFKLKIIACLIMLIDHTGAVFFPQHFYLRLIGRLSFPIFAFLIATGYSFTHDLKNYMLRLLIFGCISQAPFYYAFNEVSSEIGLNIFFTLFLGLFSIYIYEKYKNFWGIFLVILTSISAQLLNTDYGFYGVLLIFLFYIFRENLWAAFLSIISLNGIYMIYTYVYIYNYYAVIPAPTVRIFNQCYSLLALPIIFMYNGKSGRKLKLAFYIFYPLHLTIIYLINKFII